MSVDCIAPPDIMVTHKWDPPLFVPSKWTSRNSSLQRYKYKTTTLNDLSSGSGKPPCSEDPNPRCHIDETPWEQQLQQKVLNPGERGGYDCEFIERPKELQTDCPICLVVLREPFRVTCCGYSFCQTCVRLLSGTSSLINVAIQILWMPLETHLFTLLLSVVTWMLSKLF